MQKLVTLDAVSELLIEFAVMSTKRSIKTLIKRKPSLSSETYIGPNEAGQFWMK